MAEFRAYVFDGRKSAQQALDTVDETMSTTGYGWLDDVAVVSRSKHGFIRVNSTWAQSDTNVKGGIGWGAITGGLIGALAGPEGALAGTIGGGSLGGFIGSGIDFTVADPRLEELAASLEDDTSALLLVGESPVADAFVDAFSATGASLIETALTDAQVDELTRQITRH